MFGERFPVHAVVFGEMKIVRRSPIRIVFLASGPDVPRLIAARKARHHAPFGKVIEHRQIFG